MRIALGIEYDGTAYSGWQYQSHADTVQGRLEAAASRVANATVEITCAGRTDAGVHATGQVVHFDTEAVRDRRSWALGINSNLPPDINVRWVREVPDEFHARYSAEARSYEYRILNRWVRPSLERHRAAWERVPLDSERMHAAGQALLGEHDFSGYRAVACQSRTPMRRVTHLEVMREGTHVVMRITANAFLHHMVRNIAGVLMAIGRGDQRTEWAAEVLAGRDRTLGGVTAPPQGLYFVNVQYPARWELPDPTHIAVP